MMGWLQIARIGGSVLGLVALAALLWLAQDRFHQKALADAARRCESAAISASEPLDDCEVNLRARVQADRRTIMCEGALLPELRPETRFTARQACGPGTLRLIAQGDADAGEIASLQTQLTQAREGTAAAVARAEARGRAEQTRRNHAQTVVAAQPRGADGSIACDADCLRQLAE